MAHTTSNTEDNGDSVALVDAPLHNTWTLYFHDFMDTNWNRESYEKLVSFRTVREFWTVLNIAKELLSMGMFFFMRDDIFPKWDDNDNKDMSYLSMKILKTNTGEFMEEILVMMLGSALFKDRRHCDMINGISISPKKNFCICKIWIDSTEERFKSIELFDIPTKYHGDVIFNDFGDNPPPTPLLAPSSVRTK